MESEKDILDETIVDEAYDDEPSTPTSTDEESIDNAEAETQDEDTSVDIEEKPKSKKELKREAKEAKKAAKKADKKTRKRNKIIMILVAVVLTIAIVTTAIVVPIVIHNKGKIFVSSAEDFQNTDGEFYVLKDDVHVTGDLTLGAIASIDMNGKTLTVDGTLTINNENANRELRLGAMDDKIDNGILQAKNIVISSVSKTVLNAVVKADEVDIKASELDINSGINVENKAKLSASSIAINASIEFANSTKANILEIVDSDTLVSNKSISGSINIYNTREVAEGYATNATILGDIKGNVYGDAASNIVIDSKVEGVVDASAILTDEVLDPAKRVGKVRLHENSFVVSLNNVSIVYVHVNAVYPDMTNVEVVDVIRPLERVGYAVINDDTDNIYLDFASVTGADTYIIKIDDNEPIEVDNTHVEITEYVRDINKHRISVQAISKSNAELLLPSELINIEYMTYTTLKRAENIAITMNDDGKMMLTFDRVNFADEYDININGNEFTVTDTSVDVTNYLTHGGSYIVQIIAKSKNDNILASKPSMFQYDNIVALDKPTLTIVHNDLNSITLNWTKPENVSYFEVIEVKALPSIIDPETGESIPQASERVLYRTAGTTVTLNVNALDNTVSFKVRAKSGNPYYSSVDSDNIQ